MAVELKLNLSYLKSRGSSVEKGSQKHGQYDAITFPLK